MSAFIQSIEALVFALATAAFAHFGVVLKDPPCPRSEQAVRRITVAAVTPPPGASATPCPLARHVAQA